MFFKGKDMKKRTKKIFHWRMASLVFLCLLSFFGCRKPPIVIGLSMNFTGPGVEMAVYVRDGALLAVKEINQGGGVLGRPLKLLVRNDNGTREGIEKADLDLIRRGAIVIIGHRNSRDTLIAYPIAMKHKILLLSPACASSRLTGKDDLFIRTTFVNNELSDKIIQFFKRNRITKILSFIDLSNEAFSRDLFKKLCQDPDFTFNPFFLNSKKGPDYLLRVNRTLCDGNPQAIFFLTNPAVTAFLAQKCRALGCNALFYATTWAQTQDLYHYGGNAVGGLKIFTFAQPGTKYPPFQEFVKKLGRMGLTPNIRNALGYEIVRLIAEDLERAGRVDPIALKNALINRKFRGVIAPIRFDKFGDPHRPIWLLGLREDGRMETMERLK